MDDKQTQTYNWRAEAFRWGLIAGSLCVSLFAVIYFTNTEWLFSPILWVGSMLIYLLAMWKAQSPVVDEELKAYIQPGFLVYVIANALFYLYYSLLMTRFDANLVKLHSSLLEKARESGGTLLPVLHDYSLLAYMQSLVVGFAIAAMIAFFLKRRRENT